MCSIHTGSTKEAQETKASDAAPEIISAVSGRTERKPDTTDCGESAGAFNDEVDLRAEDDAAIAAELEEEAAKRAEEEAKAAEEAARKAAEEEAETEAEEDEKPKRPRRSRTGGRTRRRSAVPSPLEGTFDHGEEGYGLWLDPAVQDDPTYAEHWAGHRPVTVTIETDRIVISRAGEEAGDAEDDD